MSGETVSALARVGFDARVNLGMPLQIMLTYEAFLTHRALVLPII
jgi:hypothetical protein